MLKAKKLIALLILTGLIMGGSLLVCETVYNDEEMADIRLGYPVAFLSLNMQRYTPLEFPQCFRVGSPWEDPMQLLWPAFLLDVAVVFGGLLASAMAIKHKFGR